MDGWICPKCKKVYSPNTQECWRCNGPGNQNIGCPDPTVNRAYDIGKGVHNDDTRKILLQEIPIDTNGKNE